MHLSGWAGTVRPMKDKRQPLSSNAFKAAYYVRQRGGRIVAGLESPSARQLREHQLEIRCKQSHVWRVQTSDLLYGRRWCPRCNQGVIEEVARAILEATYDRPFRPQAIAPGLCIPGFCEREWLAFECLPHQHEERALHVVDDRIATWCQAAGVQLIRLPFVRRPTVRIVMALVASRLAVVEPGRRVRAPERALFPTQLYRLRELAAQRDGTLLSKEYLGDNSLHRWRCHHPEHGAFSASVFDVKLGKWCKRCHARCARTSRIP